MQLQTKIACAYVMTHDSGHAPNPFHDICTLAICTPNHMRSRCKAGDWIIGLASAGIRRDLGEPNAWRIIYAMRIGKKLDLDSYYKNPLYEAKIPKLGRSAVDECGDNFYCKDFTGQLHHTRQTHEHRAEPPGTGIEKQDMDGNRVFLGERYWYFGRNAPVLPRGQRWAERLIAKFSSSAVGLRYVYEEGAEIGGRWSDHDLSDFLAWLPEEQGLLGNPTHWTDEENEPTKFSTCSPRTKTQNQVEYVLNGKARPIAPCGKR